MENKTEQSLQNSLLTSTAPEKQNEIGKEFIDVELARLKPFPKHPFKVYKGEERFDELVESIREHGIITPLIVRQTDNGEMYILSGHNRAEAAKELQYTTVPCVILSHITNAEALMIVLETNTKQRGITEMKISEQANICSLDIYLNRKQGKRNDLIRDITDKLGQLDSGQNIYEESGKKYGLSRMTIARLMRINILSNALKERVDNEEISIRAAVELSYLKEKEMAALEQVLVKNKYKVIEKTAKEMRERSRSQELDYDSICDILNPKKPKKTSTDSVRLGGDILKKYFPEDATKKEIIKCVDAGLIVITQMNRLYPTMSTDEIQKMILNHFTPNISQT